MNKRRAIVLDFDGTIADTAPIIKSIYKNLSAKNGWTPLTEEAYANLRKGSLSDARKWSGIRFWQLPHVVRSAKKLVTLEAQNVAIFPGMVGLIRELDADESVDLYVLSRNTQETITAVLERKNLSGELHVLTMRRLFGGKAATLKKLVKTHNYNRHNVWMVGDETRDIKAARKAGVKSIAVSWGIQDVSILKRYKPTKIVDTVDELRNSL